MNRSNATLKYFTLSTVLAIAGCCAVRQNPAAHFGGERALPNVVPYANPMYGTGNYLAPGGENNCFPGAVAPFGMIQWSPDTEKGLHKSGYFAEDRRISDFSLDHLSGAGCTYGEDFAMMPITSKMPATSPKERTAFAVSFSRKHETATPGYYSVVLDNGVKVELTTSTRSGFGRFTWPAGAEQTFVINAASDINRSDAAAIYIDASRREITGWSHGGYFCNGRGRDRDSRTVYFYAVFNRPFANWSVWSGKKLTPRAASGTGTEAGAYISFDASAPTVLEKVGISYVSIANAKNNVETENPVSRFAAIDFDRAARAAADRWNSYLKKIQIQGGTLAQRQLFYSMLYHTLIGPCVVSDANGQYLGYDAKVHRTAPGRNQYGVFSGWDIYRSECQLLAMLWPKQASDMAQSLLLDYQQGGTFPRWGVATQDSGTMMGDPAAPMIADFYAFGAKQFDTKKALAGLVRAATDPSVYSPITKTHERDALADYLKLGYVPEHQKGGYGNVSMTLEYDSADFALAQFAQALGDTKDYAMLMRQAQNWRNLFNPRTGYLQMRRRDGSWAPHFANDVTRYDGNIAYVEGTAAQYTWMVPFNLKELAEKMGGPDVAAKRLDTFFTNLDAGDSQYANLGNEPCLETPWIYDFLDRPWKTQWIVRRAMTELYSPAYAAFPGNDDVGEMASWYVWAALGMYPELPGSKVLVLGSPLFPKAVLHLPHGNVTIIANGAAADAPYVQSLQVNGHAWSKAWISFHDISHGAKLVFDLSTKPNRKWGSAPADAPPSYSH